ncbi:MAG TPA: hypothetical protein VH089_13035 [Streptosporangiaceae bacterium]|jgi:hypothetical protein|nr:hypothetical protein [Streptosporangiaceae bacterium]
MTSDRARKKAARAQQAATGQPYMQAWRSVQPRPDSPAEPVEPPPIDPRDHAIHAQHWGDLDHHLVLYRGRYYTWITDPDVDGRPVVRHVPSEEVGRRLVDEWQALNILHTPWDDAIEHIFLMGPGAGNQICYDATVADVEGSGLWLACRDQTVAGQTSFALEQFTELGEALSAFADHADAAAAQAEQNRALSLPGVLAAVLRYRAAKTRADVSRAHLGDALRGRLTPDTGDRGLSPVLHAAGLDRESLGPVLEGREFSWPTGAVVRPPGSRRADTPVTELAEYTVEGQQFTLLSYRDSAGANCVAIAHDGHTAEVKNVSVDENHLVSQGSWMPSLRDGPAAVYGRAHDSVTGIYSVGTDGERTDWPIHDDPRTAERYFAVVAAPETLADIVVEAPTGSTSLRRYFGMWFNPPGRRPRYVPGAEDGS